MKLVRTLLIALTILMSGCLAVLTDDLVDFFTDRTTEFFRTEVEKYKSNPQALSILQSVLESLTIYHLPAEKAFASMPRWKINHIEGMYCGVIKTISEHLSGANNQAGITKNPTLVAEISNNIIHWADEIYRQEKMRDPPEIYEFQKLFVVSFLLSQMVEKFTPEISKPRRFAALSIVGFDFERLCVCTGIMLSIFLGRPLEVENHPSVMLYIPPLPKILTMWDGFLLQNSGNKVAITSFMDSIMPEGSNKVPLRDFPDSLLTHVHTNFIDDMVFFVGWAENLGMQREKCEQLLLWATRVWDWILKPYGNIEKHRNERRFKRSMVDRFPLLRDDLYPATEGPSRIT